MKIHYLFILLFLVFFNTGFTQDKIALVIGNSSYQESPLRNPVNDATDIAGTLSQLGFQVTLKTNLNHQQMESVIRSFGTQINSGDVALFYFSGHGTQVDGLNYLVPVGEKIYAADEVKYKSVEAGFVLDKMESAGSDINIVILDACRNNPFKGFRSSGRGFAYMSAPNGTIVSYATAPGSVALDGIGRNSPYTKYLIQAIQIERLQIEDVFKKVREYVAKETGNKQIPWESSSLIGDFYFQKDQRLDVNSDKMENSDLNINSLDTSNISNKLLEENKIELMALINSDNDNLPTDSFGLFTDSRDNKTYKWVRIGDQIWMGENLNFRTSDNSICYKKNSAYCKQFGRLYKQPTPENACPEGWHLPGEHEWQKLIEYLGGNKIAGGKMKEKGNKHWTSPNNEASNQSNFSAVAGGKYYCDPDPYKVWWLYGKLGSTAYFWAQGRHYYYLTNKKGKIYNGYQSVMKVNYKIFDGHYYSIRCIKN